MKLTVYFENAFWYGLVEYTDCADHYKVLKYIFGSEPKDSDIFTFIYKKLPYLIERNDKIAAESARTEAAPSDKRINPKRMQRELNKVKNKPAVSTKAQMELARVHDLIKKEKKLNKKKQKQDMKERQFQLKKKKRLEKKKGH